MSHKENWLEKQFEFDFPASRYVEFLQTLRETPARLEALVKDLPAAILTRREGDSWSIQENAGHLITTESLFFDRLEDFENDAPVLRPGRFDDNPTDKADFNARKIREILAQFREQRQLLTGRLAALRPADFEKASMHPRLNKPMRLCDLLLFYVEHDRHHLTRIDELKQLWQVP